MITLATLNIAIAFTMVNPLGDVSGVVQFGDGTKMHYVVQGCESPDHRWIHRANMVNSWTYQGSSVKDQIATQFCEKHFTMGGM